MKALADQMIVQVVGGGDHTLAVNNDKETFAVRLTCVKFGTVTGLCSKVLITRIPLTVGPRTLGSDWIRNSS